MMVKRKPFKKKGVKPTTNRLTKNGIHFNRPQPQISITRSILKGDLEERGMAISTFGRSRLRSSEKIKK